MELNSVRPEALEGLRKIGKIILLRELKNASTGSARTEKSPLVSTTLWFVLRVCQDEPGRRGDWYSNTHGKP